MNKIKLYSLGAACWLSSLMCYASEKFEVLPDLPDPLAYAVQPAEASTVSGSPDAPLAAAQSIGHEPSLLSVVLSLVFVILLIYITGIIYAKLNRLGFKTLKQTGDFARSKVSVVSTTPLGNNKTLHVVELDGKRMLIGASSASIHLIKDLGTFTESDDAKEYSHIEIPNIKIPKIEIPKIEIPSIGFSKLVTKTHKGIDNIETSIEDGDGKTAVEEVNNNDNEAASITDIHDENPDGIIDTLFPEHQEDSVREKSESLEHKVDPDEFALYKKYLS